MTQEELEQQIERAVSGFSSIEGVEEEVANKLVEQGYLSYDDLSVIEPEDLMEMGSLTEEQVNTIVDQAEVRALEAEKVAEQAAQLRRQQAAAESAAAAQAEKVAKAEAEAAAKAEEVAKAEAEARAEVEAKANAESSAATEPAEAAKEDTAAETPASDSEAAEKS